MCGIAKYISVGELHVFLFLNFFSTTPHKILQHSLRNADKPHRACFFVKFLSIVENFLTPGFLVVSPGLGQDLNGQYQIKRDLLGLGFSSWKNIWGFQMALGPLSLQPQGL